MLDVYRSLDNPKRDRDSVIEAMSAAVEAYKEKLAEQVQALKREERLDWLADIENSIGSFQGYRRGRNPQAYEMLLMTLWSMKD